MSLPESLERAATALAGDADQIRPANGDPTQLLELLDAGGRERLLSWLLENEPDAADELCLDWSESDQAGEIVAAIDEKSLPKPGRKVLRRARHRLRSRGVEVAESRPTEVVGRLPDIDESVDRAFTTPIDPRGARMVFLIESNPAGGLRLFELVLDEVRGVVDGEVYAAGRSKVGKFMRELTRKPGDGLGPVEVEPAAIRALIARIAEQHPADRPLPKAFSEWRSHLVGEGATPGELAREALGVDGSVDRAIELLESGEIGPWPPEREALSSAAQQLEERSESNLVLSDAAEADRLDGAFGAIAVEFFAGGFADATAARLVEAAFPLWKAGRDDDARALLAASEHLREGAIDTNRVARAVLERCLAPVVDAIRAKMGESGSSAGSDAGAGGPAGDDSGGERTT